MTEYLGLDIDYSRDSKFDELGKKRLADSYMMAGETSPQERFAYVSKAFASNDAHAQRLYDYASNHWLSYSTPILSFGRNKNGMPISCFLNYLDDSASGLVDNLSETNWLSMLGGGVGVHVGIRGGDDKSVGVMPHLKVYDSSSLAFKQGSTRRGSYAAYLDISHPDIMQFLEMRKPTGDQNYRTLNLNHGINIPDKFMQIIENCMLNKDADDSWNLIQPNNGKVVETVSAKALWMKILELRMMTGEPYLWFIDRANEALPDYQKKAGLKNHGSNLCVAPETLVLTREGYQPIADLEDETLDIWNGKEWSQVEVKKTGEGQKLIRVVTNSGFELECTPYHKFYIAVRNPTSGNRWFVEKRAHELVKGDKLIKCDFPIIEGTEDFPNAYANGFYSADGCEQSGHQIIYLYGDKKALKHKFEDVCYSWTYYEPNDREIGRSKSLLKKFTVPTGDYTIKSKLEWFAGLCDGDGTVARNGKTQSIQVGNINRVFLLEIQLMLQTLGVSSKVTRSKEAGWNLLPANDGTGSSKEYWTQEAYRLLIGQTGIVTLQKLGFKTFRLSLTNHEPNRECNHFVKIEEVIDEGRFDDTYCFTEPKRSMGVFNGILTGNCSEISLATSKDRTAVCCLSSVNIEYFDDWKNNEQFLPDILEMLDNVLQYFIDNAPESISRAKYSAMRERSVGVGALGYHAYLQKNNIAFEGVIAKINNNKIFSHIREGLDSANEKLAIERGACPDAADYGVMKRCSHVMAVAPNASSSIIMGNTSPSIEPFAANAYRQDTSSGAFLNKNKHLDKLLLKEAEGKSEDWYDDTWASIIANDGSVAHLEWMDEYTKSVFATASEIDQRWIIDKNADRQKFVDQAISCNVFFKPDASVKYLSAVHFMAWKLGLKSLYYLRSSKLRKADKVGQKIERKRIEDEIDITAIVSGDTCLACEG